MDECYKTLVKEDLPRLTLFLSLLLSVFLLYFCLRVVVFWNEKILCVDATAGMVSLLFYFEIWPSVI